MCNIKTLKHIVLIRQQLMISNMLTVFNNHIPTARARTNCVVAIVMKYEKNVI